MSCSSGGFLENKPLYQFEVLVDSSEDSRHRLLNLPSSRSESPELYISEYAHFLPSPDTAPSVHLSPGLVEEYLKAVEVQRPALRFLEPPESGRSKGSSYDGKWSEEAIKRYKEYKKTWNKYRITKKKSTEDDDLQ